MQSNTRLIHLITQDPCASFDGILTSPGFVPFPHLESLELHRFAPPRNFKLPVEFLRNLTTLSVLRSGRRTMTSEVDRLWQCLTKNRIHLHSISMSQFPSPALIKYLRSYSGLRKYQQWSELRVEPADPVLALAHHAATLSTLRYKTNYRDLTAIRGFPALRSLHIHSLHYKYHDDLATLLVSSVASGSHLPPSDTLPQGAPS